MKLVTEGPNHISYRFEPGEEIPKELPRKAPISSQFRKCSRCGEQGVFEHT